MIIANIETFLFASPTQALARYGCALLSRRGQQWPSGLPGAE